MSTTTNTSAAVVRSLIPARLDRLPWTRFHTRLIMALGTAWILDGLEITLAGAVAGVLTNSDTLHMSSAAVGTVATVYLIGEVVGALVFGKLSDKLGRRKLFAVTLGVYLIGSGLTAATADAGAAVHRLPGRRRSDDHRRPRRARPRRPGPGAAPRGGGPAAVGRRSADQGGLLPGHAALGDRHIGRRVSPRRIGNWRW